MKHRSEDTCVLYIVFVPSFTGVKPCKQKFGYQLNKNGTALYDGMAQSLALAMKNGRLPTF